MDAKPVTLRARATEAEDKLLLTATRHGKAERQTLAFEQSFLKKKKTTGCSR